MSLSVRASDPPRLTPWLPRRSRHGARPAGTDPALTSRQVLIAFLAFFAAVFAMNGVLIYWAIATNSGLVAVEPYRKGLHYNERIAADERQKQLGWSDKVALTKEGSVKLVLKDKGGEPVSGLKIETVLGRPATSRQDIRTALTEVAPGRYEASTGALAAGIWLVSVEARGDGAEPLYRIRRRVWLTP